MDFKFPPFHENYHMPQITFIDILVDVNIFFNQDQLCGTKEIVMKSLKNIQFFFFKYKLNQNRVLYNKKRVLRRGCHKFTVFACFCLSCRNRQRYPMKSIHLHVAVSVNEKVMGANPRQTRPKGDEGLQGRVNVS